MSIDWIINASQTYRAFESMALASFRAGNSDLALQNALICNRIWRETPVRYRYLLANETIQVHQS